MRILEKIIFASLVLVGNVNSKVAILMAGDNGGHVESAKSIETSIRRLMPNIEIDLIKTDRLERYYNMYRFFPRILSILLYIFPIRFQRIMFGLFDRTLGRNLANYDLVIANFPIAFERAAKVCSKYNVPLVIMPLDIDEAFNGDLIDYGPKPIYMLGTEYLKQKAANLPNVVPLSGLVLRDEFRNIRKLAKTHAKEQLELDMNKPTVLVLFGSSGSVLMHKIAKLVAKDNSKQYIFICGRSHELIPKIQKLNPSFVVHGFVKDVAKHIRAADLMIGKPGPGCISEAVQCETKIIVLDRLLETLPQEVGGVNLVVEKNYGARIRNLSKLIAAIDKVLLLEPKFPENNASNEVAVFVKDVLANLDPWRKRLYRL